MSRQFWGWLIGSVLLAVAGGVFFTTPIAAQGSNTTYLPRVSRAATTYRGLITVSDGNDTDIYTLRPDGSDVITLTDNEQDEGGPDLSPAKTWVSYVRSIGTDTARRTQLWWVRPDGSEERLVLEGDGNISANWSPDGKHLAIYNVYEGGDALYLSDADIITPTLVVTGTDISFAPVWSPDSAYFAYTSVGNLYTVPAAGGTPLKVAEGLVSSSFNWSPDSALMVFIVERNDAQEAALVQPDGRGFRYITESPEDEFRAVWADNGQQILVTRGTDYTPTQLILIPRDGGIEEIFAARPDAGTYLLDVNPKGDQVLWETNSELQWQPLNSTTPTPLGYFYPQTLLSSPTWSDDFQYALWDEGYFYTPSFTEYKVAILDFTVTPPVLTRTEGPQARASVWLPGTHSFSTSYAEDNSPTFITTLWNLDTDTRTPIPFNNQLLDYRVSEWWTDSQ